jgi:hypothetical protein
MNTLDHYSPEEIEDITGLEQPAAQERWFAKLGIRTPRNRRNEVVLSRTAWAQWQLGGRIDDEPKLRSIRHGK